MSDDHAPDWVQRVGALAIMVAPLVVLAALIWIVAGCGATAVTAEPVGSSSTVAVAAVLPELEVTQPAEATAVAVRVSAPTTSEPKPEIPVGLHGLPFAPDGLADCDEMMFYAAQAGLPERFRSLGYRESRCTNRDDVRTFCCHGYWQLYVSTFLRDHRAGPRFRDFCAIYSVDDVNSDHPLDKQRQACGAAVILDIQGYQAWSIG